MIQTNISKYDLQLGREKTGKHFLPKKKKILFTFRDRVKAPIFWPPDVKSQLTGKDLDAAKDCM